MFRKHLGPLGPLGCSKSPWPVSCVCKRMKGRKDERMKGWKDERMKGWKDERMKEWKDEEC